jgi:hypothetical protein
MTTPPSSTPASQTQRRPSYLRRELLWAIALKLVVLFAIKAAFFPHRLPAKEAALGLADRIASSSAATPTTTSKDQP